MEFIFIFAVVFIEVFLVHLLEIMQIIRAFVVNAFVYDKVLTVFLGNKSIATVRTPEF